MMNDELLIKFLLQESNNEENEVVKNWLAADEKNQVYFAQVERIWNESGQLSTLESGNADQAWDRFKVRVQHVPAQKPVVKIKRSYWIGLAATVLIAVGSWLVFSQKGYIDVVSNGGIVAKLLPDGSELTLNKHTTVSYAKNFRDNRSVRLMQGEVFFEVAKDRKRPFTINMDQVNVTVIGTSFNIKHSKGYTEVLVESGVVKVTFGKESIQLVKGEKILIDPKTKILTKKPVKSKLYNYYRSKLFIADQTPLYELVATLNEAYGTNIVLDENVRALPITIPLEVGSMEQNLKYICQTLGLKISRNQHEIRLSYP